MTDVKTPTVDVAGVRLPFTGAEYLESLRDGREVWIYGERVADVTTHPAFRNSARSVARLYDALHDPQYRERLTCPTDTGNGGFTHPFFRIAHTREDLRAARDAIRIWAELTFGWMGRTPDYKAGLFGTLGADPDWYGEYADNARRWYRDAQEQVLYFGHALVNPPVDRDRPPDEVADVFIHVEKETDAGLIVSGAKVVATGSPITHGLWISAPTRPPMRDRAYALTFMAPVAASGVKFLARASYESSAGRAASPFDYPLSSRLDENDAIVVFDQALIPWENVLVWDVERIRTLEAHSGWGARALLQAATRMTVKLEFLSGLLAKALDIKGGADAPGIQAAFGEVIAYRNTVAAIVAGMIEDAEPHHDGAALLPNRAYSRAYAALAPGLYRRAKEIIETVVGSGLIYLNSNAVDFATPAMRGYLDRFLRGSKGITAVERSKTMKLLWDAIGSEFGGRHELYELHYFAPPEVNYRQTAAAAQEDGALDRWRALVDRCMDDYDLDGWTAPDLISPRPAFSASA